MYKFVAVLLLLACPFLMAADSVGVPSPPLGAVTPAVTGLELPADQTVDYSEGFVTIKATTKGEVKWLVLCNDKVKFVSFATSIIVSVPPKPGETISVYAVAIVDGKMTDFAQTKITVQGSPVPVPPVNPNPAPNANGKLHLTFLVDMNSVTPEMTQLLQSESLRKSINAKGAWFRLYDVKSPIVQQKKLDTVLGRVGQQNALVIQDDAGRVLYAQPIPKTEAAIMSVVNQLTGGK